MDAWVIWLIGACVLGVGEMHQGGFYLAPFALGAVLAAIVSLAGTGTAVAAIVFVVASAVVFLTLRPVARRHRHLPPSIRTGAAALAGKPAVVLERLAHDAGVGGVRLGGAAW